MTIDNAVKIATIAQSVVTIAAILVGSWWTYWWFFRKREGKPRAEFDVDMAFIGTQDGAWLVEISATVENKGLVSHRLRDFTVALRYLCIDDNVVDGRSLSKFQVRFPHSIDRRIGGRDRCLWSDTYIEPGIKHRNSYVTFVPTTATFVLLLGSFEYAKAERFTAQRLVRVPATDAVSGDSGS